MAKPALLEHGLQAGEAANLRTVDVTENRAESGCVLALLCGATRGHRGNFIENPLASPLSLAIHAGAGGRVYPLPISERALLLGLGLRFGLFFSGLGLLGDDHALDFVVGGLWDDFLGDQVGLLGVGAAVDDLL
jgi:hypothetical protein